MLEKPGIFALSPYPKSNLPPLVPNTLTAAVILKPELLAGKSWE